VKILLGSCAIAAIFFASGAAGSSSASTRTLTVVVPLAAAKYPAGASLTVACGTYPKGRPPNFGSPPLTRATKDATRPSQAKFRVSVPLDTPRSAGWIACWPVSPTLDPARTTRMVVVHPPKSGHQIIMPDIAVVAKR
jgi:hypothetical protein